jgi:CxxC motif-containing protein (DUF1111 family)
VQSAEGIEQINASTVVFFVNSNAWADVHYRVNGGPQQNLRMVNTNGRNEYVLNGLSSGDQVSFWFTYLQDNGIVIDTATEVYTLSGGGNTNPPPADSDNDGVPDSSDQCPNTPTNTVVNSVGCAVISTPLVLIQAEDYVAFNDSDAGNNGGEYRNDDVDIENTSDTGGGFNVGWTEDGEWLEYNVTLGAGTYNVTVRVASNIGGGAFDLSMNGSVFASTNVDNTSGWQSFTTVNLGQLVVSSQGEQTFRMTASSGGFNINWIQLSTGAVIDTDSDNDGVPNASDQCPNTPNGVSVDATGCVIPLGAITPLFNGSTALEQAISFDRGDALVTRFADRGRDRHAKEDQFQIYDHYLSKYWVHRTAQFQFVDYVAKGGNTIEITFITEWKLGAREFRAFYRGLGTVAEYHGNYFGGGAVVELDNGSYDFNFNKVSDNGNQYRYRVIVEDYRPLNWNPAQPQPLQVGQRMEFEASQFLDAPPEGRANYYGTTYLYIVGEGLVPWKTVGTFGDLASEREDSYPIAREGWLGGNTTLPYNYTNEPDNHFMQMATNLSNVNGQNFVEGRRLHHSSFLNGQHDERNGENGVFNEVVGKVGTHYVNESCAGCHVRNGRATAADVGESLDKWVFKIGDANGNPDAQRGSILQPRNVGINAVDGEGNVSIANWVENNGLRSPEYQFTGPRPARFSGRIAPNIIGMGLLEAIPESDILAREDTNDANGDGISGKANRIQDPETGETRLGRFGWKAAAFSIEHQIAVAFNGDMGVMTNMLPNPDCGSAQTNCGSSGSEVSDADVDKLTKYIALLGVRAQRDLDNPVVQRGKQVFNDIGCASCHTPEQQTSAFHPLAELRSQTFYPYTDMLLHDMGPGLADNLGEGQASGSEWRTAPLWGTGLSPCVTGGVRNNTGAQGDEYCTPERSYLHDGRARTVEEAILWHGGESQQSKVRFESVSQNDKNALLTFLDSL